MKKILITVGYKKRELEYICLLASFLEHAGFVVKIIYANYEVYQQIFSWKPDIILLGQVNQNENIAVAKYAHQSNVRVVVLNCEGTYNQETEKAFFGVKINDFVDFYIVWGKQQHQDAKRMSDIAPQKIIECGTPKFDLYHPFLLKYFKTVPPYKNQIDQHMPTICVACSFMEAEGNWEAVKANVAYQQMGRQAFDKLVVFQKKLRKAYINLTKKIAQTGRYNVILRVHPVENDTQYRKALKNTKNVIIDNSTTPVQLFSVINLLIHRTSTIAIEAWIAGIPTLSFDPLKNEDGWMYEFTQFEHQVHSEAEALKILNKYKRNFSTKISEEQNAFLKLWYSVDYKKPRFSSEKIVSAIKKISSKPRRFVWHPYVGLYYFLLIFQKILFLKNNHQVIGLIKGSHYRQDMKKLYITDTEVKEKVTFFTNLLSDYFSSI